MYIEHKQEQAFVGLTLDLSTRELIALKNKAEQLNDQLALAKVRDTPEDKPILIEPQHLKDLLTFIDKLTQPVKLTSEVEAGLFLSEEELIDYKAVKASEEQLIRL